MKSRVDELSLLDIFICMVIGGFNEDHESYYLKVEISFYILISRFCNSGLSHIRYNPFAYEFSQNSTASDGFVLSRINSNPSKYNLSRTLVFGCSPSIAITYII